jgi:hypothetical protein
LIIGVRDERIESIVSSLGAPKLDPPHQATVSRNLEEIRPASLRGDIYVDGPRFVEPAAETVAERVHEYGLPYARKLTDLSELAAALEKSRDFGAYYRAPIAFVLTGNHERAQATLDAALARIATMKGPYADQFRTFAGEFLQRFPGAAR